MGLARNFISQKKWAEAIGQLDYLLQLYPDCAEAYCYLAHCYMGQKDWSGAVNSYLFADMYSRSSDNNSDLRDFHIYTTDLLSQISAEDEAFPILKRYIEIMKSNQEDTAKFYATLGFIMSVRNKYAEAAAYIEKTIDSNRSSYTLMSLIDSYINSYEYEKCQSLIDELLEEGHNDFDLQVYAASNLEYLGQYDKAVAAWDSILAQSKNTSYKDGYLRRGVSKIKMGKIEDGIHDLSMAIAADHNDASNFAIRADIYNLLGKTNEAKKDYERVLLLENDTTVTSNKIFAHQALGNNNKAIEILNHLIAKDTTNERSYYNAARLYTRMNKNAEALTYLNKALSLGYKDFVCLETDYDIAKLRNLPEYKALIKKYKAEYGTYASATKDKKKGENHSGEVIEIPFTKERAGGLCKVKCSINGLQLYFFFDTGASDVAISQLEATFMLKNGYLSEKDIIGSTYFGDAAGNINVGTVINLKKVNFGGIELTNVRASVAKNQQAPLLLGQTVLSRLGKIEIDNKRNVLRITKY